MEALAVYRQIAQQHAAQRVLACSLRRAQAWEAAHAAAELLKTHYHVDRVVVFGSLTEAGRFHLWSDVDLAVWGLAPGDYFEAVAQVLDVGGEIKIDLLMAEKCKPFLREAIFNGTDL